MDKQSPLAKRRKALGLSQVDLAQMLGMTQASVSRNETAAKPDMRFVLALEAIELKSAKTRRAKPASAAAA